MLLSPRSILKGIGWTTAIYFISVAFRFGSSVILSRLLAPNIMGMMLIVNTIRIGVELFSDVGLGQNIVQSRHGGRPSFYNTAWIMQIIRGLLLSSALFLFSAEVSKYYHIDYQIIQISAVVLFISGLSSTSIYLLHRQIKVVQMSIFDLSQEILSGVLAIVAALISPSIWSLVIANVIATVIRTISTYFVPDARQRLIFSFRHAREIVSFGKWIFLSSLLMFLSANIDRLYLGQVAPLALLGIYGIARAIADLPSILVNRLSYSLVFPVIALARSVPRAEVRANLSRLRRRLLSAAAFILAGGISVADVAVRVIYDDRYLDAAWMLPLLLSGVWLTIIASLNEYTLLGLGRPVYGVVGNSLKLLYLFCVLPFAFAHFGMLGAVVCTATADLPRIPPILFGQLRERFSFVRQDLVATMLLVALVGIFSLARRYLGFGTTFDFLPL